MFPPPTEPGSLTALAFCPTHFFINHLPLSKPIFLDKVSLPQQHLPIVTLGFLRSRQALLSAFM